MAPARRRRLVVAAAALLVAVVATTLAIVGHSGGTNAVPQVASLPSATAAARQEATSSAAPETPTSLVMPGTPIVVQVPKVGIDAKITPIAFKNGNIDPPGVTEAYWIEAYGAPGLTSDNTVYLVGHSWDQGDAVFNPLFDRASQSSNVEPNDSIIVTTAAGAVHYVIDRYERYPRTTLAEDDEVWQVVPGRLVLVTCFQPDDGSRPTENFVVYAHAVP